MDVNAGRAAMVVGQDTFKVAVRVNIAAAKCIARQLRLRDIGGLVMIDFIDMATEEDKRSVEQVRASLDVHALHGLTLRLDAGFPQRCEAGSGAGDVFAYIAVRHHGGGARAFASWRE